MKTISILLLFSLLLGTGASLADESYVTIYNKDLGLVKQIRTLDIKPDDLPLRFTDVAAKIIPTSVHLRSVGENQAFHIMEQNFEYDLISSDKILEKYIDHTIEIIKENGDLIKGTLLSKQGGSLVIQTQEKINIIPWNNKMSIIVAELPEGLITRPTLIWELSGVKEGKKTLEVSYLTRGMSWHAEYVAVLNDNGTQLNLEPWVSINNQSGATFNNARLKLVAGDIHRAPEPKMFRTMVKKQRLEVAEAPAFEERTFFEYHIYDLERLTTIKNNQIKQIALFPPTDVVSEKQFFYNPRKDVKKVEVRVLFTNKAENGLGKPLPAGIFRIYQKDAESLEFIGEDRIDHTPRNEVVNITVGKAFDLLGERKVVSSQKVSERAERQRIEIELRNNKLNEDVTIIVEEVLQNRNWELEQSNFEYKKKDAQKIEFKIPVKAGKIETLRYTVLYTR